MVAYMWLSSHDNMYKNLQASCNNKKIKRNNMRVLEHLTLKLIDKEEETPIYYIKHHTIWYFPIVRLHSPRLITCHQTIPDRLIS